MPARAGVAAFQKIAGEEFYVRADSLDGSRIGRRLANAGSGEESAGKRRPAEAGKPANSHERCCN